jgi:hypothetical protein
MKVPPAAQALLADVAATPLRIPLAAKDVPVLWGAVWPAMAVPAGAIQVTAATSTGTVRTSPILGAILTFYI